MFSPFQNALFFQHSGPFLNYSTLAPRALKRWPLWWMRRWPLTMDLPFVVMDILSIVLVFYGRLFSGYAHRHDAQGDDVFRQTEHFLHHFCAVHIGMQAGPHSTETHCVRSEKQVLCCSRDVVNPEIRHLTGDCFGQVAARDDSDSRMITATRIR